MERPTGRYRIIHLNEHGYTRNGKNTPRGFGVIAKTLKEVESEYRNIVIKELKKNYEYFKHNKDVNSRR